MFSVSSFFLSKQWKFEVILALPPIHFYFCPALGFRLVGIAFHLIIKDVLLTETSVKIVDR